MFVFSTTENILFQKFTKMAAVTFFGSSHACRHHWFPQHFLPLFEYSTRLVIQPEDIVGQSGRKMDERAVRDIIQCARKKSAQKQFIVVNLGTNKCHSGNDTNILFKKPVLPLRGLATFPTFISQLGIKVEVWLQVF